MPWMKRRADAFPEQGQPSKKLARILSELSLNDQLSRKVTDVHEIDDDKEDTLINNVEVDRRFLEIPPEIAASFQPQGQEPNALILYKPMSMPNPYTSDEPIVEFPDEPSDSNNYHATGTQNYKQITDGADVMEIDD